MRRPSVCQRFIARAKFLLEAHQPFRAAIDEEREQWNKRFPAFAISGRELPPDPPFPGDGTGQTFRVVDPPALTPWILRLREETPGLDPNEPLAAAYAAHVAWVALVKSICHQWWPPANYPNWISWTHPSAPLVAGCLIYDFRFIKPEWIIPGGLRPHSFSFDPSDPQSDPFVRMHKETTDTLMAELNEILRHQPAISHADLAKAVRNAELAGLRLLGEISGRGEMFREKYWVVPIYAAMTRKDWDSLADEALAIARREEDGILARARDMLTVGASDRAVAETFGLSRPKIRALRQKLVKPPAETE